MSEETCERCGAGGPVVVRSINQKAWRRLCGRCVERDRVARSRAAHGRAGRPRKPPEEVESVEIKFVLNKADMADFESFLRKEGYPGPRNKALKSLMVDMVANIRFRNGERRES